MPEGNYYWEAQVEIQRLAASACVAHAEGNNEEATEAAAHSSRAGRQNREISGHAGGGPCQLESCWEIC